jgi:hypothetical protein
MLSWPPATTMSASPSATCWAPRATARRPEPQTWLMPKAASPRAGRRRCGPGGRGSGPGRRSAPGRGWSRRPRRRDAGALEGRPDRGGAELVRGGRRERAVEAADGRAGHADAMTMPVMRFLLVCARAAGGLGTRPIRPPAAVPDSCVAQSRDGLNRDALPPAWARRKSPSGRQTSSGARRADDHADMAGPGSRVTGARDRGGQGGAIAGGAMLSPRPQTASIGTGDGPRGPHRAAEEVPAAARRALRSASRRGGRAPPGGPSATPSAASPRARRSGGRRRPRGRAGRSAGTSAPPASGSRARRDTGRAMSGTRRRPRP